MQVVCLDRDWAEIARYDRPTPNQVSLEHQAYTIYTSGSTGQPKGVAMTQRALTNLILWQISQPSAIDAPTTLQFAPISFDVSFQEMFATWCVGGKLVLITEELRRDPFALLDLIERQSIERLFLPFVALQQLAEVAVTSELFPPRLREIITAGEQLQITPSIRKFFDRLATATLHNHYGPSESHVVTTFSLTAPVENWPTLPPIGRPIANTQMYVLDSELQPVPIGIAGELYIGGVCLARGYLHRPDLTAEKFIADPFSSSPTARLYKTGDLARYLPTGDIEYIGRIDNQVKIRGFRIELGEIEVAIAQFDRVRQAVVIAREDRPGDKRLVAYIVLDPEGAVSQIELRHFLQQILPSYMVPSAWVFLDDLPITPSGKVDRLALPIPSQPSGELDRDSIRPRDRIELQLAEIWQEVLDIDIIGIDRNFFDLGGDSLLAVKLFTKIYKVFQVNLPVAILFQAPTIQQLAQTIRQSEWVECWRSLVPLQTRGTKPPFFLIHTCEGELSLFRLLISQLGVDRPIYGLQAQGLDGGVPFDRVEEMAAHYITEIQTIQPEGPYLVGGKQVGAFIALEMAQQLVDRGLEVEMVVSFGFDFYRREPLKLHEWKDRQIELLSKFGASYILNRFTETIGNKIAVIQNRVSAIAYRFFPPRDTLSPHIQRLVAGKLSAALHAYVPQVYSGKVAIFRPLENYLGECQKLDRLDLIACNELFVGGFEIYYVPGTDAITYTSYKEPHVKTLAQKLQGCLDRDRTSPDLEPDIEV
jgi:amino acid adenylation domain-containing protein